jgi:ABC-2 type transport system ATP-binding protein
MSQKFDDVVSFAELEAHIDQQVKFYSSGMYVRLGFAVAVNMDPDILLVDEVLSVGDELFQRKCLDRVKQFQREGRTIIFVTHSVDLVRQICGRVAVLDRGDMVALDTPGSAVRTYREHLLRRQQYQEAEALASAEGTGDPASGAAGGAVTLLTQESKRNFQVRITAIQFEFPECDRRAYLVSGEPLIIHIKFEAVRPVDELVVGLAVHDMEGRLLFGWNTDTMGLDLGRVDGRGEISFSIAAVPLLDGTYPVTIGLHSHDHATVYDWHEQRERFEVMSPSRSAGVLELSVDVTVRRESVPGQAGVA